MKRDMDLIRRILEYLESQPRAETVKPPEFPNVSTHEVRDHARLCRETGYISEYTETLVDDGPPRTLVSALGLLAWQGHERLDAMRLRRPCG